MFSPFHSTADMAIAATEHLLRAAGTNQKTLAEGMGIRAATLSQILHKRRSWSPEHIDNAALFFRMTPVEFLTVGAHVLELHGSAERGLRLKRLTDQLLELDS